MRILILLIPLLAALTPEGVLVRGPKIHTNRRSQPAAASETAAVVNENVSASVSSTPSKNSKRVVEDIDFGEDFDIYNIINPGGRK